MSVFIRSLHFFQQSKFSTDSEKETSLQVVYKFHIIKTSIRKADSNQVN